MKVLMASFLLLFFTSAPVFASGVKLYGVKSGVFEVQVDTKFHDKLTRTREVLVWDDWGLKIAKYEFAPEGGTKTIVFYKSGSDRLILDKAYLVQLSDMSFEEVVTVGKDLLDKMTEEDQKKPAEAFLRLSGSEKSEETKEWDGRVCEVWVHPKGNKNCIWNGIRLYKNIKGLDIYTSDKEPKSLYEGEVDPENFEVPGLPTPDKI